MEEKLTKYWKLKRAYNTLELKYETLQTEDEYKDRVITRLKNENEKLKEEKKQWLQPKNKKQAKTKKRKHTTSVRKKKKI